VSIRVQQYSAYMGYVFMGTFVLGFWILAGFIPPPSPADTPAQIAHQFQGNTTGIRFGMLICAFGAGLLMPWSAAIAVQMKRAEGRHGVLTYTQIMGGALLVLEFIYPLMYWMVTAFRPHEAYSTLQHLNDLSWLCFLGVVETAVVQAFAIGIVAIRDERRDNPVFPRWFAYFNFWCGTLFCPAALIVFFKHGAFAWNGIISWWLVASVFFAWMLVVTVVLQRAIKHQQAEEASGTAPPGDLAAQLAALQSQVTKLTSQLATITQGNGAPSTVPTQRGATE
jgi:hypothetical protein